MDRFTCKSCGGALQKIGETAYKCMHCGTVHQLGLDDAEPVRALMEQNNRRWLHINRRMEQFYDAVNRAAVSEVKRGTNRMRFIAVNVMFVVMVVVLALAFATSPADSPEMKGVSGLGVLASFLNLLIIADIVMAVLWFTYRSQVNAAMTDARGILADVLATYRQMSERPTKDLLQSLHNAKYLSDGTAESLASRIYGEVIAASPTAQA